MQISERHHAGQEIAPGGDPLDALRVRLAGQVLVLGSDDFDRARITQNILVDRQPMAIVRAATAGDVAAGVDFARQRGIPLAVRSGGHSIGHHSMVDDAIVIDLSGMKRVTIDPRRRIAHVQAGATSGDLAGPASEHGLALSTGDTSSVGMGGLVTGGGVGFMVRKHGLAIDNLLSAEVVTADGAIVTASDESHPDLFWAIRGGGGNVGIVTEFTFRMAPVAGILGGELMLPATRDVIRGYLDYVATAPEDLTTIAHLMHAPPFPHVPPDQVGRMVLAILVTWTGDPEAGERALAPLRALAMPIADAVGLMPYASIYGFTEHQAAPLALSLRMMFADAISDATIDAALDAIKGATSPFSIVQFRGLGGAISHVPNDATAFAHRDRQYFVSVIAVWLDAAEDAGQHQAWTTSLWEKIRHDGDGVYVNFLEGDEHDRILEAYPQGTYERLAAIKQHYDPGNLFRFNQNVPPSN